VQAQKELARQKQSRRASADEETACNGRLVRAKQAAAATIINGRLGPSEQATLSKAAAAEAARAAVEARVLLSATAAAAVEKGGLQPAAVARLERAAREEHTKQLAARNQRRAAAARVGATRRAQVEEERAARKTQLQEERERRSARRARVCEHVAARRLMEERWAAAQAAKERMRTADQEHQSDAAVSIPAAGEASHASKGSLMESAAVLLDELLQDCEEDTVQNISEEERVQMESNADNIDFEMLDAKGSISTLIKYTVLASVRPVICGQLEFIASSEKELPEPAQHCALLRCLVKLANEDESCSVAALSALHEAVSWPARIKQQEQAAEELHLLRKKLDAIAREREALEAETDVLP
jgi:hypothetical protein